MIRRVHIVCLLTCGWLVSAAAARTFETRDAALRRIFPAEVVVDRMTAFLSEVQMQQVEKRARAPLQVARVTYYNICLNDSLLARVYLDTHAVRSMQETLLIVLGGDGQLVRVDVLAFHEPEDYLPTPAWYELLVRLERPWAARAGDGVDAVSGATLTVNATCAALRRVCSIDDILHPKESAAP
jgi:hypothetical protein